MLTALIVGVLTALMSTTGSAVVDTKDASRAEVVNYHMDTANMPNSYNFYYDTSDGSSRTEHGAILNPGSEQAALNVDGSVRWYDDKGQLYEMVYKAGKRGYRTSIKKVRSNPNRFR